jgi:outer membrane protein, heavy metal efflux system
MRAALHVLVASLLAVGTPHRAFAGDVIRLGYAEALALARERAPAIAVARGREVVAEADARVGGIYPNPAVIAGTSTQTAKLSVGATVPLVILGQIGAATRAGRAELATVEADTRVAVSDVRAGAAHAFVALWLAQRTSEARTDAATITQRLDDAVRGRVEVGSAPELEALRARAERLRADADARAAADLVGAAAADLGRWIGTTTTGLRVEGDPTTPDEPPPFADLAVRVQNGPSVRREELDAHAAEARADRERALVRPGLVLDFGADIGDPTLPATNYRGQLGIEVPLFNQRGPLIERELGSARVARLRARSEATTRLSDLTVAYETFVALTHRLKALDGGVVPAAEAAAQATEESYTLGRATLVAVLDSERARIDARLSLLETKAARANAWIDAERAAGQP